MIEIVVTVHVRTEKGVQDKDVLLVLETMAPVADINPKSWTLGRWRCKSYYLGADLTGNYAVVNQHLRSGYNPTGLFYDTRGSAPDAHEWPDDEDPFLLLWGFDSGDARMISSQS